MPEAVRVLLAILAAGFFTGWGVSVLILNGLREFQEVKGLNYLIGTLLICAAFSSYYLILNG